MLKDHHQVWWYRMVAVSELELHTSLCFIHEFYIVAASSLTNLLSIIIH